MLSFVVFFHSYGKNVLLDRAARHLPVFPAPLSSLLSTAVSSGGSSLPLLRASPRSPL